jgi:hypothetical protein
MASHFSSWVKDGTLQILMCKQNIPKEIHAKAGNTKLMKNKTKKKILKMNKNKLCIIISKGALVCIEVVLTGTREPEEVTHCIQYTRTKAFGHILAENMLQMHMQQKRRNHKGIFANRLIVNNHLKHELQIQR